MPRSSARCSVDAPFHAWSATGGESAEFANQEEALLRLRHATESTQRPLARWVWPSRAKPSMKALQFWCALPLLMHWGLVLADGAESGSKDPKLNSAPLDWTSWLGIAAQCCHDTICWWAVPTNECQRARFSLFGIRACIERALLRLRIA